MSCLASCRQTPPRGQSLGRPLLGRIVVGEQQATTSGTPGTRRSRSYRTRNRTGNGASSCASCEENHSLCYFTNNLLFCGPRYSPCNSPCLLPTYRSGYGPGYVQSYGRSHPSSNRPDCGPFYGPRFRPSRLPCYGSGNLPRIGADYFTGYRPSSLASGRGDGPIQNVVIDLNRRATRDLPGNPSL